MEAEGTVPQSIAGVPDARRLVAICPPAVPMNVFGLLWSVEDLGVVQVKVSEALHRGTTSSAKAVMASMTWRRSPCMG